MRNRIPRMLPYQGHTINYTGPGRSPGSLVYLEATTGSTHEVYLAQVERTGPVYSLARVANNPVMGPVRVDHALVNGAGPVHVGEALIIGSLRYLAEGPCATVVWKAPPAPRPSKGPKVGRQFGVISRVLRGYGWISAERTGRPVFLHQTQLQGGARLRVGLRVSFVEAANSRGPAAYDVWPA